MKKILITGKNGNVSTAIAEYLKQKHGVCTEQLSLRDGSWSQSDLCGFDAVIHVAGIVPKDGINPEDFYRINYRLTEEFAKKVKDCGIKHFIYISSMAVYGLGPQISAIKGTITDKTSCNPTTDYGKSKLLAENSLRELEDENFKLTVIRVPSIYGEGKTEYLDQYKHLADKFKYIPKAFTKNYKSMIYIDNLCELIYLIVKNAKYGIVCPDDGEISAFDVCRAIRNDKKVSRLEGVILSLLKYSSRIADYYGTICYCKELTEVFENKYRVCELSEAVVKSYEE